MSDEQTEVKIRLEPQDEYTHTPDTAANYNESMYFNMFDPEQKVGGWFRIGNRPNEGYAETSVCIYLPDGRIGFMFGRPTIENNDAMDAGGLRIDVHEPLSCVKVTSEVKIDNEWDEFYYQTALTAQVKTNSGAQYQVEDKVLSLIPLRNRRTTLEGEELNTRTTEGMTEYRYNSHVGYGLSEYLDQIVDGKPTGLVQHD